MRSWLASVGLAFFFMVLTGCCGTTWDKQGGLSLDLSRKCEKQGKFLGDSSSENGDRCETYELQDKTYKTICDKSSPLYRNPSAQPYPDNK
jgi:hypothetical protein